MFFDELGHFAIVTIGHRRSFPPNQFNALSLGGRLDEPRAMRLIEVKRRDLPSAKDFNLRAIGEREAFGCGGFAGCAFDGAHNVAIR